ncbi:helicase ATP-binding domain-containing protein, partial [Haematococcus lacustris]
MDWADAAAIAAIVRQRGYKRLALQFPDSLLSHSPRVASAVQELLGPGHSVAVLADTAFNAESVDEVAAQHMIADCVGLLEVVHSVPDGVLVFLPSYGMLEKLSQRWQATGVWQGLSAVKEVVVEPREAGKAFEQAMLHYKK